jgi:hypothetical protein
MIDISHLLQILGYDRSQHSCALDKKPDPSDADVVNLLRASQRFHAHGVYAFRNQPASLNQGGRPALARRAAMFVAIAQAVAQAKEIHRRIWDLSHAPCLIVLLPHQVRVSPGFDYTSEDETGLLKEIDLTADELGKHLGELFHSLFTPLRL